MACFGIGNDKVLVGKSEGKRPLGRPQEDGIRMDFREICWGSVEWILLAEDRDWWRAFVNTVISDTKELVS
jgi:hypothetical protein